MRKLMMIPLLLITLMAHAESTPIGPVGPMGGGSPDGAISVPEEEEGSTKKSSVELPYKPITDIDKQLEDIENLPPVSISKTPPSPPKPKEVPFIPSKSIETYGAVDPNF